MFGPTVTLARVALARDQDEQAEQWFRESLPGSLARYASEGVDDELGWCYEGLAMIAFRRGQTARSARLLGMAWALVLGMAWALGRNGPDDPQPPVGYDSAARGRYSSMHAALRDPFFLNEWCWGRDRPEAQAIAYALK